MFPITTNKFEQVNDMHPSTGGMVLQLWCHMHLMERHVLSTVLYLLGWVDLPYHNGFIHKKYTLFLICKGPIPITSNAKVSWDHIIQNWFMEGDKFARPPQHLQVHLTLGWNLDFPFYLPLCWDARGMEEINFLKLLDEDSDSSDDRTQS